MAAGAQHNRRPSVNVTRMITDGSQALTCADRGQMIEVSGRSADRQPCGQCASPPRTDRRGSDGWHGRAGQRRTPPRSPTRDVLASPIPPTPPPASTDGRGFRRAARTAAAGPTPGYLCSADYRGSPQRSATSTSPVAVPVSLADRRPGARHAALGQLSGDARDAATCQPLREHPPGRTSRRSTRCAVRRRRSRADRRSLGAWRGL